MLAGLAQALLLLLPGQLLEEGGALALVAVLVLLAAAAGTGLVAPDLGDVARRGRVGEARPDDLGVALHRRRS